MSPTSLSLLDRLKDDGAATADWNRLHDIYRPLIQRWLRGIPGLEGEADDLTQEVMLVLVREVPRFDRRREGSFRAWLRQVCVNRVRTSRREKRRRPDVGHGKDRTEGYLDELSDPRGDLARQWDLDHDQFVFQKLLTVVEPDFNLTTWAAFRRFAFDGLSAAAVGEEFGLSVTAVIQSKARILKRLREEAGDLLG